VYRGPDGALRFNQTTFTGAWGSDRPVISNLRFPLYIPDYTSPGIVWAALGGGMGLYGAFAGSDGRLDLWYRDPFDGFWYKTDRMEGRPGPIESRPALQWVPNQTTSEIPGRLYLVYVDPHSGAPDERELRMRMSYVKVDPGTGEKTTLLGLDSAFDNTWLYGYGIDLLYDVGIDTNLRAAFTVGANYGGDNPDAPKEFQVWYRPVADGIFNYVYTNHNDWQVLRVGICRNVVDPAGVIPDADEIQCPPKDW
jgi:hypothetical protein